MSENQKGTFENVNDLLKAILWPVLILFIFFTFKNDIINIVHLIPDKIQSSSKISVGGLSIEIEKSAINSGDPKLAGIIKNLSEQGIRKLLTLGKGSFSVMVNYLKSDK